MTTDSGLNGTNILRGATLLSFVAQFLPFHGANHSYLTHTTNLDVYTGIHLDLTPTGNGWQQHPTVWVIFVGLAVGWFTSLRRHDGWQTWGPWITVIALWFAAKDSAPFQSSGGGLAFAAFVVSIWGAWRARSERKADEAAAAAARRAAAETGQAPPPA